MSDVPAQQTKIAGLAPNIASLLCYIPFFGIGLFWSLAMFFTEPKENKLVRFNAVQSLMLLFGSGVLFTVVWVIIVVLGIVGGIIDGILGTSFIGAILGLLGTLVFLALSLGLFVCFLLAIFKAFQGQMFRIPVFGQIADKISG